MKANKNSLHSKLYKFTYNSELPINLCPYFWKLVFAFIVFIPNFILQLPPIIFKDTEDCKDKRDSGIIIYILLGLLYLILFFNYHLIKAIFGCYSYTQECVNLAIGINTFIFVIVSIIMIDKYQYEILSLFINQNKDDSKEEKTPNIIIEFIKAKKNKYCPKIDWE